MFVGLYFHGVARVPYYINTVKPEMFAVLYFFMVREIILIPVRPNVCRFIVKIL